MPQAIPIKHYFYIFIKKFKHPIIKPSKYQLLGVFLFAVLCYFPLFLHLDTLPLRLWDEARRGVNVIEFLDHGHWFIPHFDGHPDMWGTKPPLLIWCQAFFAQLFGVNELSIRLPSALAGVATAFLLIFFARNVLRRPLAGYFGVLVLLTTGMYIRHHGPISGDYDALLTLWETAYLMCGYLFLARKKYKWLYWMAGFILLAGWTKGAAGLFFLPGLALFYLITDRGKKLVVRPRFWLVAIATLLGIVAYYFIREIYNPAYLDQVWNNELFGRYTEEKGSYGRDFWYYFTFIYQEDGFFPWLYFLPLAFFLGYRSLRTRYFTVLVGLNALLFFLLISTAATRLSWYCVPVFPLLALMIGIGLERLYQGLQKIVSVEIGSNRKILVLLLFLLSFFAYPYGKTVYGVYTAGIGPTDYYSELYRGFIRQLPAEEKDFTIFYDQYSAHPVFYRMLYNRKGYQIKSKMLHPPRPGLHMHLAPQEVPQFGMGEKLMICEKPIKEHLEKHYEFEAIHYYHNCQLIVIKGKR